MRIASCYRLFLPINAMALYSCSARHMNKCVPHETRMEAWEYTAIEHPASASLAETPELQQTRCIAPP